MLNSRGTGLAVAPGRVRRIHAASNGRASMPAAQQPPAPSTVRARPSRARAALGPAPSTAASAHIPPLTACPAARAAVLAAPLLSSLRTNKASKWSARRKALHPETHEHLDRLIARQRAQRIRVGKHGQLTFWFADQWSADGSTVTTGEPEYAAWLALQRAAGYYRDA